MGAEPATKEIVTSVPVVNVTTYLLQLKRIMAETRVDNREALH